MEWSREIRRERQTGEKRWRERMRGVMTVMRRAERRWRERKWAGLLVVVLERKLLDRHRCRVNWYKDTF
jgi:hypothetical protein